MSLLYKSAWVKLADLMAGEMETDPERSARIARVRRLPVRRIMSVRNGTYLAANHLS